MFSFFSLEAFIFSQTKYKTNLDIFIGTIKRVFLRSILRTFLTIHSELRILSVARASLQRDRQSPSRKKKTKHF